MRHVPVATTVSPEHDHVTALEQLRGPVTVIRRCESLAELVSVARAGLAEAVLVAGDVDLLTLTFLESLDAGTHRPIAVVALAPSPAERDRLAGLGVPVLASDAPAQEVADLVIESVEQTRATGSARWRPATARDSSVSREIAHLERQLSSDPEADAEKEQAPTHHGQGAAEEVSSSCERLSVGPAALFSGGTSQTASVSQAVRESTAAPGRGDGDGPESLADADQSHSGPGDGRSTVWRRLLNRRRSSNAESTESAGPDGTETQGGEGSGPRITTVWGPAGSPGRTTVAVNLAVEMVMEGRSTLLIDLDTYASAAAVHLGLLEETAGIARACHAADQGTLSGASLRRAAATARVAGGALDVLTGLTRADRWPELRRPAVETVLEITRQEWQEIVVDVGFCLEEDEELSFDVPAPQRNAATRVGVMAADRILAVGTGDPVGLPRLIRGLDELESTGTTAVIEVVLNQIRADSSGVAPRAQVQAVWERFGPEREIAGFLPWDRKSLDRALLGGQVLAEAAPNSALRKALSRWATPA